MWESDRLTSERLQQRLARRGPVPRRPGGNGRAYVVFDLVHEGGTDLTGWPYVRRRAALEALFADHSTGRSTTLSQAAGRVLAGLLTPPVDAHPGRGGRARQAGEHSARSMCIWCSRMS